MRYTLAVFRTRFATLNFANLLKAENIPVAIVNTPHTISRACGISVKFLYDFFPLVQRIFVRLDNRNFAGFYLVDTASGKAKPISF